MDSALEVEDFDLRAGRQGLSIRELANEYVCVCQRLLGARILEAEDFDLAPAPPAPVKRLSRTALFQRRAQTCGPPLQRFVRVSPRQSSKQWREEQPSG